MKNDLIEGKIGGERGKFIQATFFIRFQPFLDNISINLPSSAAVMKSSWIGNHDHSGDEANNREIAGEVYCPQDY